MMRRGIHQVGASLKLIKASLTVPIECVIWCVVFFHLGVSVLISLGGSWLSLGRCQLDS